MLYPYYFLLLDSLGLFSSLHSIVLCSTANLIARKAGDSQPTRFQGRHRSAYIFFMKILIKCRGVLSWMKIKLVDLL